MKSNQILLEILSRICMGLGAMAGTSAFAASHVMGRAWDPAKTEGKFFDVVNTYGSVYEVATGMFTICVLLMIIPEYQHWRHTRKNSITLSLIAVLTSVLAFALPPELLSHLVDDFMNRFETMAREETTIFIGRLAIVWMLLWFTSFKLRKLATSETEVH